MNVRSDEDQMEGIWSVRAWAAILSPFAFIAIGERLARTGITSRPVALAAAMLATGAFASLLGIKKARTLGFWVTFSLLAGGTFIAVKLLPWLKGLG